MSKNTDYVRCDKCPINLQCEVEKEKFSFITADYNISREENCPLYKLIKSLENI